MLLLRRLLPELAKFGVVGVLGIVVDVGGFNLLRYDAGFRDYPLTAKVLSAAAATVASWLGHRYWTYSQARRRGREARREFVWFLVFCTIGTGIAIACLWFTHYVLDLTSPLDDNLSGNVIGLVLATAFRWWSYRTFVFRSMPADGAVDLVEAPRFWRPDQWPRLIRQERSRIVSTRKIISNPSRSVLPKSPVTEDTPTRG